MVFDDEHIALWERGRRTTTENSLIVHTSAHVAQAH
jgi:hypothetical protein